MNGDGSFNFDPPRPDMVLPPGICRANAILCGCGRPEDVWALFLEELERTSLDFDQRGPFKETNPHELLVKYVLDHCRLTEHGGSIYGAWLTADGKEALAFLREHGANWHEKPIIFSDADGVVQSWGGGLT